MMNIYGWYNWSKKDINDRIQLIIQFNSILENLISLLVSIFLTIIIYFLLININNSDNKWYFILIESFITALNFIAMWLTAWKRVESWILWIIGDIMCIPLFIYKEYYLSVAQFSIFIIIAFMGYFEWKKKSLVIQKK